MQRQRLYYIYKKDSIIFVVPTIYYIAIFACFETATLSPTTLSFCLCFPGIVLVQCRQNLNNVDTAFAANSYYRKINWFKIKIAEKWSDIVLTTLHRIFSCEIFSGVSRIILYCTGFLPRLYCTRSMEKTLHRFFFYTMLSQDY